MKCGNPSECVYIDRLEEKIAYLEQTIDDLKDTVLILEKEICHYENM